MFQRSPRRWFVSAIVSFFMALPALAQAPPPTRSFGTVPPAPLGIVAVNPKLHNDSSTKTGAIAHMIYSGGPVMSNVQVVVVYWGPNVDPIVTAGIFGFYQSLVTSSFMNLLSEYSTTGLSPTTDQSIGKGTAIGPITIAPACSGCTTTPGTVTDEQITAEIQNQVSIGMLPAPTSDAFGYANTLYMVYFPPNLTITAPGAGTSCKNFCSYHSSFASNEIARFSYGAVPDFGGSCGVCGSAVGDPPIFTNVTAVSTHEFAESISDARPNTGWYDPTFRNTDGSRGDEIADVCAWQYAPLGSYTIQPVWSNLQGACVSGPITLTASAPTTIGTGVSFPFTITVQDSSGNQLQTYTRTIHFSSTDSAAQLPADYTFTAADNGSHAFTAQLNTSGTQQISVRDMNALGITGHFSVSVASVALAQSTQTVGPTLGTSSFTVGSSPPGASIPFKVSTNTTWLHLSASYGTTGTPFTFSYDANSVPSSRTGQISINGGTATLAIIQTSLVLAQPSQNAGQSAGTSSFVATSSIIGSTFSYSASGNVSWLHLASNTGTTGAAFSFSYDANPGLVTRTGTVTLDGGAAVFTFVQAALTLAQPLQTVSSSAGTASFAANSSVPNFNFSYSASTTAPWLHLTAGTGTTGSPFSFNYDENPESSSRTGTIILNGGVATFTVIQQAFGQLGTPVGPAVLSPQGGTAAITLASSTSWTAQTTATWVHVPASGSSAQIAFTYDPNLGPARNANIVLNGTTPVALTQASSGLYFVPVTPCRVVDTRNPVAASGLGGPEMAAGSIRNFSVPVSPCGVPSNAQAYALNVTVVPDAVLGYLSIWPQGVSQPLVSTLNSDGRVKANLAIVPAGAEGGVSVFVSHQTQVILDLVGYFTSQLNTASGLVLNPLNPCRVVDTRQFSYIAKGTSRSITISGSCGVPATAQAYSLNLTVVPHTALRYLSAWADGQPQPPASSLNASTGAVTANAAIVQAGSSGNISIYASDDTDVIVDINGYFASPSAGGLSLYTLTPCRFLDTRSGTPLDGKMAVNVTGNSCNVPSSAQAFVLNATVVPPGDLGYLSLWADGLSQPLVSTTNAEDGAVTSNMAIVPTTNGSVDVFASDPTHVILDISSYFAP